MYVCARFCMGICGQVLYGCICAQVWYADTFGMGVHGHVWHLLLFLNKSKRSRSERVQGLERLQELEILPQWKPGQLVG